MRNKYRRALFGICMLIVSMGVMKEAKAMGYSWYDKIGKDEYVERISDGEGGEKVVQSMLRTSFGKLATNIDDFYLGSDMAYTNIFIQHQGEKEVWNAYLPKKKKACSNNVFYTSYFAGNNVNGYYPYSANQVFTLDKKGRLYFSGDDTCFLMFQHKTGKDCNRNKKYREKLVAKNVKKCWSDEGMFAYVKDNRLYITGMVINQARRCRDYETQQSFFEGKGNQIEEIISGNGGCFGDGKSYWGNVYVLMKDGSVWGMGNNTRKGISDDEEKYIPEFQMIISGGIRQISANAQNVAAVKKDGTLWVWGRDIKSNAKKYSAKAKKNAQNVKAVALANSQSDDDLIEVPKSVILYVKKDGKAYGRGSNYNFMLSNRCKSKWQSKPVFLMSDVKKIGGCTGISVILTNKNELYWSGYRNENTNLAWWYSKKSK